MFEALRKRHAAWRKRRFWTAELHLEHLRQHILEDGRWLAHNTIASELCDRYTAMLAEDWYAKPVEDITQFRPRIGLDPHKRG